MDFFAQQEHARRRTWWLVVMFFAALAGLIASAYLAIAYSMQLVVADPGVTASYPAAVNPMGSPEMLLGVTAVIALIVLGGTMFKLSQLRHGGGKVAEMLGGRRLDPASAQFHERRLLNVVEEMALASGVPVPPVYVMPGQTGINAFAAGYSIHDAVVGVTEGAMRGLKREELQGVIAHEFSHIMNGDMRLNIRLIGIVHGLLVLAIVGRVLVRLAASGRSGSNKKGGAALFVALGLALIVIGYAGFFFGGLIKRAVSRQREYLADASAVQFTRNPLGLASALKKVGGLSRGGAIQSDHAEEMSHMFFADGVKRLFSGGSLFATHPPLAKRVKLLDPSFTGEFPIITEDSLYLSGNEDATTTKAKEKATKPPLVGGIMGPDFIKRTVMIGGAMATHPTSILQQVGILEASQLDATRELLALLPDRLREQVHEPLGAQGVIMALLIGATGRDSADAWTWIPAAFTDAVGRNLDALANQPSSMRLMLVDMALPAIRSLAPEQAERFLDIVDKIIHADQKVDFFEFAVLEMVRAGLRETLKLPVPRIVYHDVGEVGAEVSLLLSIMARTGNPGEAEARAAFDAGRKALGPDIKGIAFQPANPGDLDAVKKALERLLAVSMPVRKQMLEAAIACLMSDQQATDQEVELFRAFAAALEVPLPPGVFVATA